MEQYKLRVRCEWREKRNATRYTLSEFVWDEKEDAIECKHLLEKATKPNHVSVDFVAFTKETPL